MLYEYECRTCKRTHEHIQKLADKDPKTCLELDPDTACQGELTRRISKTSFSLKGTGWHKTDYPKTR